MTLAFFLLSRTSTYYQFLTSSSLSPSPSSVTCTHTPPNSSHWSWLFYSPLPFPPCFACVQLWMFFLRFYTVRPQYRGETLFAELQLTPVRSEIEGGRESWPWAFAFLVVTVQFRPSGELPAFLLYNFSPALTYKWDQELAQVDQECVRKLKIVHPLRRLQIIWRTLLSFLPEDQWEKREKEDNSRIQGKTKEENPVFHPEYKGPNYKIWYRFLTAICVLRAQLIMNQKIHASRRLILLKEG